MSKKGKIYITLTVLAILSIVVLEYTKPQAINWFKSYASHHKIPFGTFIFHEQLERIFEEENIEDINIPPFQFLKENKDFKGTYIFINNNLTFDTDELDLLLNWTAKGNTLFIASDNLNSKLHDTLNIETSIISNFKNIENIYQLQLKNKQLKPEKLYTFDKAQQVTYYKKYDSKKAKVISVIDNAIQEDNKTAKLKYPNTLKQKFGKGTIILSTFPQAFTNYFLLTDPNQNYTAGLISYMDASQSIYVDNYYKSGKSFYTSPLHILLNTKELKWAYYTMLIAVFLYVIFEGKRKQRAIPIVKPLQNQTVNFTRTIANMYYEKGKHKDISNHQINHFLEYIRTQFHIHTNNLDSTFIEHVAARSNNTIKDTKALFEVIKEISAKKEVTNTELKKLNKLIADFKSKNKWKKAKT
ncbi:DUF4350 domain-containing protein [Oceanihabitans sediminis]|uniref:DUF4350 domain-containing protein n=1 Tax=Oceanihabitans sediminis TaxID=1812012 RepID=UPI003A9007BE